MDNTLHAATLAASTPRPSAFNNTPITAYPFTRLNVFSASSKPLPARRHTWSADRQRFTRRVV